jgi:hypothetical protein
LRKISRYNFNMPKPRSSNPEALRSQVCENMRHHQPQQPRANPKYNS